MSVVIETTVGDITVDLYTKERPKSSLNFLKLCKQKKYNLCLFHTVQSNFIAQTGDPTGTGRGGGSIYAELYGDQARFYEAEDNPRIKHTKKGLISMVNCGDGMLGSQFFVTLGDDLDYLDGEHCVFGEVVEGLDTVDKINLTICDKDNRPYQDIRITHTVIIHDPYDDPPGFEARADSPEPTKEMVGSSRIGADESINDYEGKTEEEINELLAAKEAKAQATILEMVGDLPDADVAPPENVLFVCKLNPVTNDDDLEVIFSRFGKVVCCEVIRDKKSGESLQYAFVEFEEKEACEQAYFKMDNVLIDDRRIHVDFSQSVSQYRWKGKGRLEVFDDKETKTGRKDARGRKDDIDKGKRRDDDLKVMMEKENRDRKDRDGSDRRKERRDRSPRDRKQERRDRSRSVEQRRQRSRSRELARRNRSRSRSKERRTENNKERRRDSSRERRRETSRERKRDRSRSRDRKRDKYDRDDGKRDKYDRDDGKRDKYDKDEYTSSNKKKSKHHRRERSCS